VLNTTTGQCVAGSTYCSSLSPAKWYNSTTATCDAFASCAASEYWTSSNNTCTTVPTISMCYTQPNSQAATYDVLAGYSLSGATVSSPSDPGLSGDTPPAVSGNKITYTTPNRNNRWPSNGKITITFTITYAYSQNGANKTATQTGSFTITRGGTGSSNPTSTC